MKKYSLILICVIFAILLILSISACNSDKQDTADTVNTTALTETTADSTSGTEPTADTTAVATESFSESIAPTDAPVYYTKDANELEIITAPNLSDNTPTNDIEDTTEKPTEALTEPENPFTQGEPIELPFVPAQ